jgi:hypothetical protein
MTRSEHIDPVTHTKTSPEDLKTPLPAGDHKTRVKASKSKKSAANRDPKDVEPTADRMQSVSESASKYKAIVAALTSTPKGLQ